MSPKDMRQVRQSLGMTQTQFGAFIGRSKRTIVAFEMGDQAPSKSMLLMYRLLRYMLNTQDRVVVSTVVGLDP